ncbi:MAG: NAD(P)H-binding protein [Sulfitobacter sp.]
MSGTVFILGATGRFGRAATQAFSRAGWTVRAASRTGGGVHGVAVQGVTCDAYDKSALIAAVQGADVIVNAVHPLYFEWEEKQPILTRNVIAAGLASGATVMIPANVYPFGETTPEVLREGNAPIPSTRKGAVRVTMERAFEDAAQDGLRTILLRGGDYIEREITGNWFDSHITNKAHKGVFTYPGPMDCVHAWAYLPDMARAMADLAAIRADLSAFTALGFEGYSLTGAELKAAVALTVGQRLKVKKIPWWALRLMAVFSPVMYELMEMRYLWTTPHRVDGDALRAVLPDFEPTPLAEAMKDAVYQGGPRPQVSQQARTA